MPYVITFFDADDNVMEQREAISAPVLGGLIGNMMEDCVAFIVREKGGRTLMKYDKEGLK